MKEKKREEVVVI